MLSNQPLQVFRERHGCTRGEWTCRKRLVRRGKKRGGNFLIKTLNYLPGLQRQRIWKGTDLEPSELQRNRTEDNRTREPPKLHSQTYLCVVPLSRHRHWRERWRHPEKGNQSVTKETEHLFFGSTPVDLWKPSFCFIFSFFPLTIPKSAKFFKRSGAETVKYCLWLLNLLSSSSVSSAATWPCTKPLGCHKTFSWESCF